MSLIPYLKTKALFRSRQAQVPAGRRIYVIGDIHGRADLFTDLIDRIDRDNSGRRSADVSIVVLGEFIDRGPGSRRMIDIMRGCGQWPDSFIVLRGNHEQMMLDVLRGQWFALRAWLASGGDATLRSFGMADDLLTARDPALIIDECRNIIPHDLVEWLDSLPHFHSADDYLFVHAGIKPRVPLEKQRPEDLLWIRAPFLKSSVDHGVTVVHGHSITEEVEILRNRIGIDTAAYRSGRLTALGLEGGELWTLEATDWHS